MSELNKRACPDSGTCHHGCFDDEICFRVSSCGSLSGTREDDTWRLHPNESDNATYRRIAEIVIGAHTQNLMWTGRPYETARYLNKDDSEELQALLDDLEVTE